MNEPTHQEMLTLGYDHLRSIIRMLTIPDNEPGPDQTELDWYQRAYIDQQIAIKKVEEMLNHWIAFHELTQKTIEEDAEE